MLWVHPVLLGSGKKLFGGGTVPAALRLTDSTIFPNGSVNLVYELAGTPTYGNLAVGTDEWVSPSHEARASAPGVDVTVQEVPVEDMAKVA